MLKTIFAMQKHNNYMRHCKEIIEEVVGIFPLRCGTLAFERPANARCTKLTTADVHASDGTTQISIDWLNQQMGLVTVCMDVDNTNTDTLIIEDEPTVKIAQKRQLAGLYYKIDITAKTNEYYNRVEKFFSIVSEWEYFDLVVVDSEDNIYIAQNMAPATVMTITENFPRSKESDITLNIENVNGLQLLEDA